jgi:pyrroline-5-carboxylate reductase
VFASIRRDLGPKQAVLSIMAGVTIRALSTGLGSEAIIRAMPNTPGQIGAGITVWTATPAVGQEHREAAARVLSALGKQVQVPEEKYLDVATAVNGSGPAYAFLFIEALIDAGVYLGLGRDLARELAVQTVLGSATMVASTGQHPAALRDMVASPGGTTVEALLVLEDQGFRAATMKAVIAAYQKSKLLGEDTKK